MIVKHAEQREWTGGDDNKRHSDVIAGERVHLVFDAIGVRDHPEAKCRRHRTGQ